MAHEVGHTLGMRHADAFGPIGFGISNPPGLDSYYPNSAGAVGSVGAFDTLRHIMASPASVGSARRSGVGTARFGQREAGSSSRSSPAGTTFDEASSPTAQRAVDARRRCSSTRCTSPTRSTTGYDARQIFDVAALDIVGTSGAATP